MTSIATTSNGQEAYQKATSSAYDLNSCDSENLSNESSFDHKPHKMVRCPSVIKLGSAKMDGQMTRATFSELHSDTSTVVKNLGKGEFLPIFEEQEDTESVPQDGKLTFSEMKKIHQGKKQVKRVQSDNMFSADLQKLARTFNKTQSNYNIKRAESNSEFPDLGFDEINLGIKKVKICEVVDTEQPVKTFVKFSKGKSSAEKTIMKEEVVIAEETTQENPKPSKLVLTGVFLAMIFVSLSNYYFYNTPQMYATGIIEKFNVSMVHIGYMYSIMSLPNFIGIPLGTKLMTRLGLGWATLLFATLIFSGKVMFYIGIQTGNFNLLLAGRALFGLGFDNIISCQNQMANMWFKGKFLSMALGLNQFMAVTGLAVSAFAGPRIYIASGENLSAPYFVCMCLGLITFSSALIYALIHRKSGKYFDGPGGKKVAKKVINFKKVGSLSSMFWILALCYGVISMTYYRFLNIITDFLMVRFKFTLLQTSNLTSILPILNMFFIPIMSSIVQVKGKKASILMSSTVVAFIIYTSLYLLPAESSWIISGLILSLSVFFTLYISTIWSCITLSIPSQIAALGFGCSSLTQSVFSILVSTVIGAAAKPRTEQAYNNALKILIGMATTGFILTLTLLKMDSKAGNLLQLPENNPEVKKLVKEIEHKYEMGNMLPVTKPNQQIEMTTKMSTRASTRSLMRSQSTRSNLGTALELQDEPISQKK